MIIGIAQNEVMATHATLIRYVSDINYTFTISAHQFLSSTTNLLIKVL